MAPPCSIDIRSRVFAAIEIKGLPRRETPDRPKVIRGMATKMGEAVATDRHTGPQRQHGRHVRSDACRPRAQIVLRVAAPMVVLSRPLPALIPTVPRQAISAIFAHLRIWSQRIP